MNEEMTKCPKCKEEVLKGAKKCKHCGADLRNWFMRHKIISVFLILMFIGILSGGSNSQNNNNNGISDVQENQREQIVEIGDMVTVGKFSYKVQKVDQASSVGSEYYNDTASGIYEIISLTFRNNDNESHYADSTMFKLIDDQDRTFSASTSATSAYAAHNESNQSSLFLQQANPGLEIGGVLVFDIPKDASNLKLEVSGGFGSPDKAYIELN